MNETDPQPNPIDQVKRDALIADVFEARRDLSGLASAHGLSPDDLADWIGDEKVQRCLAGLCLLADLQTQLMLSRYRQVAVTELIKQASAPGGDNQAGVSLEQSRKACVDLLKTDLKRATPPPPPPPPPPAGAGAAGGGGFNLEQEVGSIRAALIGKADIEELFDREDKDHQKRLGGGV